VMRDGLVAAKDEVEERDRIADVGVGQGHDDQ
jgi:hypothetical protein